MGTCTRGVLVIKWVHFLSKDSNGYLYLRGPYNRGVLIIPRVRYFETFQSSPNIGGHISGVLVRDSSL